MFRSRASATIVLELEQQEQQLNLEFRKTTAATTTNGNQFIHHSVTDMSDATTSTTTTTITTKPQAIANIALASEQPAEAVIAVLDVKTNAGNVILSPSSAEPVMSPSMNQVSESLTSSVTPQSSVQLSQMSTELVTSSLLVVPSTTDNSVVTSTGKYKQSADAPLPNQHVHHPGCIFKLHQYNY